MRKQLYDNTAPDPNDNLLSWKRCLICDSFESKAIFEEFGIDILKCRCCGHVFSSYNGIQDYDGFFGDKPVKSEKQFWWNQAHEEMHREFCERFVAEKRGKLLDVGCGLGYFVKRMAEFPSWHTVGYELSRPAVNFARDKLGLSNVFCGRVEDSKSARNTFDIITLWDVIEHIPNPDPLLSYLASILTTNGLLFISTPNITIQLPKARVMKSIGMKLQYLEAKDHIHNYSTKTIARILRRNGFTNIRFIHLKPVQSVSGSRSRSLNGLKNLWFYSSLAVSYMTLGRINFDNLYVIARKNPNNSDIT